MNLNIGKAQLLRHLLKRLRLIAHAQSSEVGHFACHRNGKFNVRMHVSEQEFALNYEILLFYEIFWL